MTDPAGSPFDDPPRAHEEAMPRPDEPGSPGDTRRSTRTGRRAASRILLGLAAGAVTGALLGWAIGALAFGGGSRGMWASVVAGAIFLGGIGAFWGGLSGLGPPEVENDPLPPTVDGPRDERPGRGGSTTVG
jgi:hypothetical protein